VLEVRNDGNLPLDIALQAADVDRSAKVSFTPPRLRLEPGTAETYAEVDLRPNRPTRPRALAPGHRAPLLAGVLRELLQPLTGRAVARP